MSKIAKMHVAKKQLGLDDETYRDALERITGKRSAKDMNDREQSAVLLFFTNAGFKAKPATRPNGKVKLVGKFAGKLQALWIAGWNLGLVKNRDDAALTAFVKRQTGLDAVRFLRDEDDAFKAIEALKKWLTRGGVDWTQSQYDQAYQQCAGYKIAQAQFAAIDKSYPAMRRFKFQTEVAAISGKPLMTMTTERDWHDVMNAFGKRIRDQKGEAK